MFVFSRIIIVTRIDCNFATNGSNSMFDAWLKRREWQLLRGGLIVNFDGIDAKLEAN